MMEALAAHEGPTEAEREEENVETWEDHDGFVETLISEMMSETRCMEAVLDDLDADEMALESFLDGIDTLVDPDDEDDAP